jgi:hypothetical protein
VSLRNDQHVYMTHTEKLEAELRDLRASHADLLAAAKMSFCMIDRKYEDTPPYKALLTAIAMPRSSQMGADNQAERVIRNIEYREKIFASHADLLAALRRAKEIIRVWHGINMPRDSEPSIWELYQSSLEMATINAAIAHAEELAP